MNRNQEITEGFIDANTKVLVKRTPLVMESPMQLVYNPKQALDKDGERDLNAKEGGLKLDLQDGEEEQQQIG
jgi:hypothetical protein